MDLSGQGIRQKGPTMGFTSLRIITDDVDRLVAFYESVTQSTAVRPAPVFAEFRGGASVLAIAHVSTMPMLARGGESTVRDSIIVEFEVDDVDAEFERLRPGAEQVFLAPTTMPWGNRSAVIGDPDGNLVNLFSRPSA